MGVVSEWDVDASLVTPQGTLVFNDQTSNEGYFIQDKDGCQSGIEIRAEKYGVPQGDGSILRRRFTTGYQLQLQLNLFESFQNPACKTTDPSSREMYDLIALHVRSILDGGGRYLWTPTGAAQRLLDDLHLLTPPALVVNDAYTQVTFTLDSPYPYAIDFEQTLTQFSEADPDQTLDNTGTAPFYPVWKVYGPITYFTILNVTTNEEIVYDGTLPGAIPIPDGSYAEINTFRNTVYLDGDQTNLKPGVDIELSDFFPLEVGENDILVDGAGGTYPVPDVDCLWQAAWF